MATACKIGRCSCPAFLESEWDKGRCARCMHGKPSHTASSVRAPKSRAPQIKQVFSLMCFSEALDLKINAQCLLEAMHRFGMQQQKNEISRYCLLRGSSCRILSKSRIGGVVELKRWPIYPYPVGCFYDFCAAQLAAERIGPEDKFVCKGFPPSCTASFCQPLHFEFLSSQFR